MFGVLAAGAAAGAAAAALGAAASVIRESPLAVQVCARMDAYESASKRSLEPSVCGLYLHFFMSLLGALEAGLRALTFFLFLVLIAVGYLLLFFGYWIVLCLSCGKTNVFPPFLSAIDHPIKMYSLYASLFCALIGNLCCPWAPCISFYKVCVVLRRPTSPINFHGVSLSACCCACVGFPELNLPGHIMLKHFLFVGGGCSSLCWSTYACGDAFNAQIAAIHRELEEETDTDTIAFYQSAYNCSSYEELEDGGRAPAHGRVINLQPQQHQVPIAVATYAGGNSYGGGNVPVANRA